MGELTEPIFVQSAFSRQLREGCGSAKRDKSRDVELDDNAETRAIMNLRYGEER